MQPPLALRAVYYMLDPDWIVFFSYICSTGQVINSDWVTKIMLSPQILLTDHHRDRMRIGFDMLGFTVSSLQHISWKSS